MFGVLRVGLFLFSIVLSVSLKAQQIPHFVVDIDATLALALDGETAVSAEDGKAVRIEWASKSERYVIFHGVGEFLQKLATLGDVSFFSGGHQERNLRLLEAIKLPNGKSARDIATQVLSREDFKDFNFFEMDLASQIRPFHLGKIKKDIRFFTKEFEQLVAKESGSSEIPGELDIVRNRLLLEILSGERRFEPNLRNVILIDNDLRFVKKGQEKNLLWSGLFSKHLSWEKAKRFLDQSQSGKAQSVSYNVFLRQNRILVLASLLRLVVADWQRGFGKTALRDALWKAQWKPASEVSERVTYRFSERFNWQAVLLGKFFLQSENAQIELKNPPASMGLFGALPCSEAILRAKADGAF